MVSTIQPPPAALEYPPGQGIPGDSQLQHEQQFASLLAGNAEESFAVQPAAGHADMVSSAVSRLDGIAESLRADPVTDAQAVGRSVLLQGDPASVSPPAPAGDALLGSTHDGYSDMLSHYSRLVSFSLQAQVVTTSTSSTEKTFDQLMRGS